MREILFRGKRIDSGEWVEGFYCRAFRWTGDHDPQPAIQEADCFMFRLVDPATIGQYTGLTDKNRKKIFEGDIIFDQHPSIQKAYTVIWFSGSFVRRTKDGHYLSLSVLNCNEFEVIGNIHDNYELMEKEE